MSVYEDNWDFIIKINDIERSSFHEFEVNSNYICEQLLQLLNDRFKDHTFIYYNGAAHGHDDSLKVLAERNKQLRYETETKHQEITQQQAQYENFKRDRKLLSQEIKETHEAFLMAKKYYKKFLKIYYTIESRKNEMQTIYIQFFTEAKKESENYSIRLLRDTKTAKYTYIDMTPKLELYKELLQEINDLPGALCYVRQAFMTIRKNK